MTQHSSLKSSLVGQKHRSVIKRYERLKHLKDKEEWTEESSIYKLPKIKSIKVKIKKEKPQEAKEAAEAAAAAEGTAAQPSAKPEAKPEKKGSDKK